MKNTKFFLTIISWCVAASAMAIPAKLGVRPVEQPDGSVIEIMVYGDENNHFSTTADGYIVTQDDDGFYKLANVNPDGSLVSTDIRPLKGANFSQAVKLADVDMESIIAKRNGKRKSKFSGIGLTSNTYPTVGNPKGLIILVEYSDVKFNESEYENGAKDYFNQLINGENFTQMGGTGSALQYFTEQSGGKFTPDFDVLGPVTLPQNQAFYGQNDRWGSDMRAYMMLVHAVEILDPEVDFSVYDTDGDGEIDNVYLFYAGKGEASYGNSMTVWPHSWNLPDAGVNLMVDDVKVGHYACSNEWELDLPCGIGTFVHEFSHVMGLPDLYNTYYGRMEYTPGEYSVLDYGPYNNKGRTPPNYGAYELNALGWFEPLIVEDSASIKLAPISSGEFMLIPTEKETEFFLFENRQLTGWDAYIPNHGLLIWHIDYNARLFENNTINLNQNHQYVDIIEANNRPSYTTAEGYTFPGTSGKREFTKDSSPAFKSWSGTAIELPITGIEENSGYILFDVAGGDGLTLESPEPVITNSSFEEGFFDVEWNAVDGAAEYFITVMAGEPRDNGVLTCGFDNSIVPADWESTEEGWYTTVNTFGIASPSYRFSGDGQTLTSPATTEDITSIKFWCRGMTSSNTYIKIEGLIDGEWKQVGMHTPVNNTGENIVIDDFPTGVRQVRFILVKGLGNIAFDDVELSYGQKPLILEQYNSLAIGNVTSYRVDKLLEGELNYGVIVAASNSSRLKESEPIYFKLSTEAGINNIETGITSVPVYYNLQGIRVENPQPGSLLIEVKGSKSRKIIF